MQSAAEFLQRVTVDDASLRCRRALEELLHEGASVVIDAAIVDPHGAWVPGVSSRALLDGTMVLPLPYSLGESGEVNPALSLARTWLTEAAYQLRELARFMTTDPAGRRVCLDPIARSATERCVMVSWLVDQAATGEQRRARGVLAMLAGLDKQIHLYRRIGRNDGNHFKDYRERLVTCLRLEQAHLGITLSRKGEISRISGETLPNMTELFRMYVPEDTVVQTGSGPYSEQSIQTHPTAFSALNNEATAAYTLSTGQMVSPLSRSLHYEGRHRR